METDKKIIISTPDADGLLKTKEKGLHYILSIKPKNIIKIFIESKIRKVIIYDRTTTNHYGNLEKIPITDHINKTGDNPLIKNTHVFKNKFIDITKLYNKKNIKEITTTCFGEHFLTNLTNSSLNKNNLPSTHLCNIAVLCKALGATSINGVLINSTKLII